MEPKQVQALLALWSATATVPEKAKDAMQDAIKCIAELEEQLAQTQRLYREKVEFADSLAVDVKRLREAAIELRNALQDRWAANSDAELYKANARVESADAAMAALLDREGE